MLVRRLSTLDRAERAALLERGAASPFAADLRASIASIFDDVASRGDAAVADATAVFDGVQPASLRVPVEDLARAHASLDGDLLAAIRAGIANIRAFSRRILERASWTDEISPGVVVGERATPIDSAGLVIPGGKGSFPSVLMHLGTAATTAGVPHVTVVVPPRADLGGAADPAVLAVAFELGVERVFRVNLPAGIAALALGTESFSRVSFVVGPGSPGVVAAQVHAQSVGCATRMQFGPTESLIIAEHRAVPADRLAAHLLVEAEHGSDSTAILVTDSEHGVEELRTAVERRLAALPPRRAAYARDALAGVVIVDGLHEAFAFANEFGAEHVLLLGPRVEDQADRVRNAGEVLVGDTTPFSAANYVLGVPAVLPTGGSSRSTSGITARSFTRTTSIARADGAALSALTPAIERLAEHEGFPAHAAVVTRGG
jgi:histidinol dehydrogenase